MHHHLPGHDFDDATRGPRLHKVLADAGVASRRDCEALIASGAVAVNGHTVRALPAWVDPARDHITVEGRPVRTHAPLIYVMLNKPRGVICTNDDPEGRRRAVDLIPHSRRFRLYPVGRLDMDSAGLLVLTNDGDLANRLTHPRHGMHKVYEVTVEGALDPPAVQKLESGLFLHDRRRKTASRTAPSRLTLIKRDRNRTTLRMELREGRNRQIRRMMAQAGHPVVRLRRIQMGPLKLLGLKPGQWRELLPQELAALERAAPAERRPRSRPRV